MRLLLSLTFLCCFSSMLAQGRQDYFYYDNTYRPRLLVSDESGSLLAGNGYLFNFGYIDACESTKYKIWDESFEAVYESDYNLGYIVNATWHKGYVSHIKASYCRPEEFGLWHLATLPNYTRMDSGANDIYTLDFGAMDCDWPEYAIHERDPINLSPVFTTDKQGNNYWANFLEIIAISPDGEFISNDIYSKVSNGYWILSIQALADDYLAIGDEDSNLSLYQQSTDSVVYTTKVSPIGMLAIDSTLWCVTQDSLISLNTSLERNALPLPTTEFTPLKIVEYQGQPLISRNGWRNASDEGYGWLFDPSTQSYTNVMDWDFGFNMLSIAPFAQDSLYVSGFLTDVGYFIKKATLEDFAFQPRRDVGVTDVALEVVEAIPSYNGDDLIVKLRATIEVTNFGTAPVSSLCIRHHRSFSGPFQCVPNQEVFEGTLDLAGGETQTFVTEDVRHIFINAENGQQTLTKTFYTFAPDHYLDSDPSNDSLTVSLTLTSLAESTLPKHSVRLSPNPATEAVQIQSDYPLDQLLLTDTYGRIVRQTELSPSHSDWKLQRDGLPTGLYYLRVKSGERWGMQKLVFTD